MDEQTREQRIAAIMDREAGHAIPRANLWPAIRQQVQHPPLLVGEVVEHPAVVPPHAPRSLVMRMPVAASAAMLAAILVLAVSGLNALFPLHSQPQPSNSVTAPPASPSAILSSTIPPSLVAYAQPLALRQRVGGYTVSLNAVYRDAYAVLLDYTIEGPNTHNLSAEGELSAADVAITSMGWQASNQVSEGTPVHGLARFSIAAAPDNLDLHLSLSLAYNPDVELHSVSPLLTPNLPQEVAGPFSFQFGSRLVAKSTRLDGGGQASDNGVTIMVDEVSMTPSTVRLVMRYSGVAIKPGYNWQPDLRLQASTTAEEPMAHGQLTSISQRPNGAWVYVMPTELYDIEGPLRINITALHGYDAHNPAGSEVSISGNWQIDFKLPLYREH